VAAETK